MPDATLPAALIDAIRRNLPLLPDDVPITDDLDLVAAGLDSMATVSLLVEVEEDFVVTFPDNKLGRETFRTPGCLWAAIWELDPRVPE